MGRYRIEALLGMGGMGAVYRATDEDGRPVALKLIKDDVARDVVFRKRFAREARIAQTVEHPNVVPVLATGEHDGIPYMAARYIDGLSLADMLERDGVVAPAVAVRICRDVARGLEALWAAGMVHRDVKPANILLDAAGTGYVTDFGLAKDSKGSVLTLPGQALGSMDYMAPEQIRGEDVGPPCDTYALGCVMFAAVCGGPPFASAQGMRVLWAHLRDPPPDPREQRPELPARFAAAMLTALEKEVEDRPAGAGEYVRALEEALDD